MWGAIASVAGPVLGGLIGADSAGDAAATQAGATAGAIAEQRRQYDQNRTDLAPYRQAGGAAINKLSSLLGLKTTGAGSVGGDWKALMKEQYANAFPAGGNPAVLTALYDIIDKSKSPDDASAYGESPVAFAQRTGAGSPASFGDVMEAYRSSSSPDAATQDPEFGALTKKFTLADFWDDPVTKASFQFGLDEGTKALDRMAGARGNRNSGAQLKALNRFATDYTGQQAGQSQARFVNDQTNLYNRLAGISGTGQTAANTTAALGSQSANTIGGMLTAQGNARGAAQIAQGNAIGGALSGIGNYYQSQNTLDKILNRGGYGGYGNNSPINPYTYSSNYG